MVFTLYKPGQGYWTRVLSACGAGVLILSGIAFMVDRMSLLPEKYRLYIQAGSVVVALSVAGSLFWWVFNKPRVGDFLIATEAEMKKVNWPTRREIIGSTWVVICGTFILTILMTLIDVFFALFFRRIGILQG